MAAIDSKIANPDPKSDQDSLMRMRDEYKKDAEAIEENHEEALDDLRFRAGDQWDNQVKQDREKDRRPCLTVDYISQHVRQVTGDIRLNKPAIKVRPVDSAGDKDVAELMSGLIRHIEQQSDAASVYARAGDNMATCGEGAFRITTLYTSDDSFDQDIRLERINNPLAVIWDRNAKELTKEDGRRCWVLERYATDAFKEIWPDASTEDFEASHPEDWVSDWYTNDTVLVAEYWTKRDVKKTIAMLAGGQVIDWSKLTEPERAAYQQTQPEQPIATREVMAAKVERYVVNGAEILEGPEEWPGKYIPVIPVFGEEIYIGDELVRRGMVRMAKDPQRMINYHNSAAVETVSLSPKSPFIGTVEQFAELENIWKTANTLNHPYLPYNPDAAAPGAPQRSPAPQVPAALLTLKQESVNDLNNATGIHPASLGAGSVEKSGKAILARERQGDVGTFVYIDNLSIAIAYGGRQLVDLIPKIYDGQRMVRILGEDDAAELVSVNEVVETAEGPQIINDLSRGKYDVVVSTGPSYSTKRQESAEAMLQFMQTMPGMAEMVMDLLAKNLDWPGAEEIAKRFRKLAVAKGLVDFDPEQDEQEPQPEQPDPKDMAEAEKTIAEAEKTAAEAKGQELENAQAALSLSLQSGELQGMIENIVREMVGQQVRPASPPGVVPFEGPIR